MFALPGGGANGEGNARPHISAARPATDGDIFGQFDLLIEYDFANASTTTPAETPSFNNLTTSPARQRLAASSRRPFLGYVRFGVQDKPIGMGNNTSVRPAVHGAARHEDGFYGPFDNGYALGIAAELDRIGTPRPGASASISPRQRLRCGPEKYAVGGRVTGTPWYEDDGRSLVHLGLGYWGASLEDELRPGPAVLLNAPGFPSRSLWTPERSRRQAVHHRPGVRPVWAR